MSEETQKTEIEILKIEPGGEDEPGFYWCFFGDEKYAGPFETYDAAIADAQAAIKQAYEMALGDFLKQVI